MPNTRMLLWFALAAILYFNYEAWMHDYPAGTPGPAPASTPAAADTFAAPPASAAAAPDATSPAQLHVSTDVLDVLINLKGGELDQADLKQYPQRKDTPNIPVRLLNREPPNTLY